MVNTVNNKYVSIASFFTGWPEVATRINFIILPVDGQRRGHCLTTVNQSDMRELGTVWIGFAVELPLYRGGSFSGYAYSHRTIEGFPDRDRTLGNKPEGLCFFYQMLPKIKIVRLNIFSPALLFEPHQRSNLRLSIEVLGCQSLALRVLRSSQPWHPNTSIPRRSKVRQP